MRLNGMTAVVTGGASGMGESMIYALAKEGASIVVVDRNVDGANAVATNVEKEGGGSSNRLHLPWRWSAKKTHRRHRRN